VEGIRGRSFEGSGIGLALVQELVKLHGGNVSVESVLAQGSTFKVSVPKGKAHLPQDRIEAALTVVSTSSRADSYVEEAMRWIPDVSGNASAPTSSLPDGTLNATGSKGTKDQPCFSRMTTLICVSMSEDCYKRLTA
jgi:hypothetical protein